VTRIFQNLETLTLAFSSQRRSLVYSLRQRFGFRLWSRKMCSSI